MSNKLSLVVNFLGVDKLSGTMKNILGASKNGSRSIRVLNADMRTLRTELRDVGRQMKQTGADTGKLVDREKALRGAIERANQALERQKRLAVIDARTAGLSNRGREMVGRGMSDLMWARMAMAPVMAVAKASAEYEGLKSRLRVLGLGDAAINELTNYAEAMNVAGSATKDNLRYLLEAQGVFRESGEHNMTEQLAGAKLMAPLLAKMHVTGKAMSVEMPEEQERYFLRFIEQAGGTNDSKRAASLTDGLFRALQSSGGVVQASDYQGFLARAGSAGSHLSARAMFADFEPLIAEMHESAGVGLATGTKMATGIKANSRAAAEYLRLGLWDKNKVVFNSLGGVKSTKGNPLMPEAASQLAHSPVDFYRNVVLPAYQKNGINTAEARTFENAKLFGGTGGNLFNLIDKQLPTILRSRTAYDKTQGLDQAYNQTKDSFFGEQGKFTAALQNFMVVAGTKGGLLDNLVYGMQAATAALKTFTAFGNAHPTAFAWIATIATDLIALRVGLAVVRIVFGTLLGPVAQLWGLWSKYKELGSLAALFPRLAGAAGFVGSMFARLGPLAVRAFGLIRIAALFLARGVLQAGAMMLANPIVLAITAIAVGLGVAGYLIYSHWSQIKQWFRGGVAGIKNALAGLPAWLGNLGRMMMQGLLGPLNPMLLGQRLLAIARSGIVAFKNFFGIKSPSRLMMQMGGHMTSGLALGLDRGAEHPHAAMSRVMEGLAAAPAMRPASIGARRAAGGEAPITVNVYGERGQDVDQLADRVIRKIELKRGIKARSSYEGDR